MFSRTCANSACCDWSKDAFSARVISCCSECAGNGPFDDCFVVRHSYTIEVVEVFKESHLFLYHVCMPHKVSNSAVQNVIISIVTI